MAGGAAGAFDGGAGGADGTSSSTTQAGGGSGGAAGSEAGGSGGMGGSAGAGGAAGSVMEAGVADVPCTPESDLDFCARKSKNCGTFTATDNCGVSRMASCGTCAALQACAGGGVQNVCGAPPNLAQGGTVAASNPGVSPEDMAKAFDGDSLTKWFAGGVTTPWIAYTFANNASHTVTSYAVTSANDAPDRDPTGWQLQGSNVGNTWTTIDTRTGEAFANRWQTNFYTCTNTTAYKRYRFLVTANNGSVDFQVDEIQLFGN
jgi:NedA-like, galactose-binding domain